MVEKRTRPSRTRLRRLRLTLPPERTRAGGLRGVFYSQLHLMFSKKKLLKLLKLFASMQNVTSAPCATTRLLSLHSIFRRVVWSRAPSSCTDACKVVTREAAQQARQVQGWAHMEHCHVIRLVSELD